jgi:glycosyltransferase involved in cell wall biosynthesis
MLDSFGLKRPLISVCIPTYNRAGVLGNLLQSLQSVKAAHGNEVEICVSDNNSSDNTVDVIEAWRAPLGLKVIRQHSNIGGSLNIIEVTRCARGRWVQLIGDDDVVDFVNFGYLLDLLRASPSETWVLVGIADEQGQQTLLANMQGGPRALQEFQRTVLRTGVYPYGFIGMHVIPAQWLSIYHSLSREAAQSWAHLALFLRFLAGDGGVTVFPLTVVRQAGGGRVLFWKADDWARVNLKKLNVIAALKAEKPTMRWFCKLLLLRELYSARSFREIVLWKALEGEDFDDNAFGQYGRRYARFGFFVIFVPFHLMLLAILRGAPASYVQYLLRQFVRPNIVSDYAASKANMAKFDGIGRGL